MAPSLSVCLVTRNEEASLPRVLGSVSGVADEVLVMDTGSTDGTVALAGKLGARVAHVDWNDDFSAARNAALDRAGSDWILWLNPDEELLPERWATLPACLGREDVLAFLIPIQEVGRADQPELFTLTEQPRLFRRHSELRYVGRLHPRFSMPILDLALRENRQVIAAAVVVRHHGYLSALTEAKLRWAVRLLERELADRPGDLHYLIEYGHTLLRLNDPKGHAVLAEATERLLPIIGAAAPPVATVGRLVEYLLTVSPEQSRARLSRGDAILLGQRWFPESPPVLWAIAQSLFQAQDFHGAAAHLEKLVHLGRTGAYNRSASFDPTIMGDAALVNLGACFLQIGERKRAEQVFRQIAPGSPFAAQASQMLSQG
jgi:hypothetical protein